MSAPAGIGAALGPHGLTVAAAGTRRADPLHWAAAVGGAPRDGAWPELEAALAELRGRIGARPAVLDVALLPPWSGARVLEFPRLRPEELEAVLRRDARRYFLEARGPQVAAAQLLGPAADEGRVRVLAAVAPEALAEAVRAAAAEAGWRVRSVVPAHAAWAAAAGAPAARLLLGMPDGVEAVTVRDGRVEEVRRVQRADAAPGGEPVAVVGEPAWRAVAEARLAAAGAAAMDLQAPAEWAHSPAALAAGFAGRSPLRFVTPAMTAARVRRARRAAVALASAAAALLVAAGALEAWGVRRELDAVRDRRREVAPAVREVARARDALRQLDTRFATLRALEGSAPQWPVVVTLVAQRLPADARLTAFRAEGDSLLLEGEARRAARVFDALARVPGVVEVRPAAPIRREFREGAPAVERFALTARLGARRAAPAAPPTARKEAVR